MRVGSRSAPLLGAAVAAALIAPPASGQDLLRWRLDAGDTIGYRVTTSASSRSEGFGVATEIGTEQAITANGLVREVGGDGSATVEWTYTRVEVASSGPPPMGLQRWDSAVDPARVSVPTALRPQIELLAGRLGRTVTSVQTRRGEVRDLRGVQEIADGLLRSVTDPVLARMLRETGARLITPEAVRQTFGGAAAFLPDAPVGPGDSWVTPRGEAGTSPRPQPTIELTNTVRSIETLNGERIATIQHEGAVPVEAGGMPAEIRLNGVTVFSIDRGLVLSSTLTTESVREMPVPGPGGATPAGPGMRSISIATIATELVEIR